MINFSQVFEGYSSRLTPSSSAPSFRSYQLSSAFGEDQPMAKASAGGILLPTKASTSEVSKVRLFFVNCTHNLS